MFEQGREYYGEVNTKFTWNRAPITLPIGMLRCWGKTSQAANLGFSRVFSLAPEAVSLTVATVDLLIVSTSSIFVPKFGVVSGDTRTPERKSEALDAVKNKILYIFLIVIIGYPHFFSL
ncbi:ABC transporter B family member 25 [Forsythia ovata]|uniref:ABC transporter B family member 25 n=1 Tax=Forsythia ovata TaxID=205694 RepID=A0ABD1QSF5_9LAMI